MAGGNTMKNEVPTTRAKAVVPKAREKQAWAGQPWQELALLSQVTLQHCGTCERDGADLHGSAATEAVPGGGQPVTQPHCPHHAGG